MIEIRNLRLKNGPEWTKLIVDISAGRGVRLPEKTMWFALPNENADMFNTEVYDPFLLVSYYIGMFYGQDVRIYGNVSKLFYKNLTNYASQILDDFSDHTQKVELLVNGFGRIERTGNLIGASCSCGVDSLCSIYDHYVNEDDPDYKINSLFLFNCGTHGGYGSSRTTQLWKERFELNKQTAEDLNLPVYMMDSNLHAFTQSMYDGKDEPIGYLAIYSCALCLQKAIHKYYISCDFSYAQTLKLNAAKRDFDLSEFAAPMFVPLIRTEAIELIVDLPQYRRAERLEHIADWEIAQKHLNICIHPLEGGGNCTVNCAKCRTAMIILESLGKTDSFQDVFDVELFHKKANSMKAHIVARYSSDDLCAHDTVDFVKAHGMELPSFATASIIHSPQKIKWLMKQRRQRK